jgi:hypothetical protein
VCLGFGPGGLFRRRRLHSGLRRPFAQAGPTPTPPGHPGGDDHLAHYLEIERLDTQVMYGLDLMPGSTKEIKINLEPGRYRFWYPFHRTEPEGVQLVVTVTPAHAPAYPY